MCKAQKPFAKEKCAVWALIGLSLMPCLVAIAAIVVAFLGDPSEKFAQVATGVIVFGACYLATLICLTILFSKCLECQRKVDEVRIEAEFKQHLLDMTSANADAAKDDRSL